MNAFGETSDPMPERRAWSAAARTGSRGAGGRAFRMNLMTSPPPAEAVAGARTDYPLWLMSLSTADAQSSQWTQKPAGRLLVTVHPDAAAGIADGGLGRLESPIGSLDVRDEVSDSRLRQREPFTIEGQ